MTFEPLSQPPAPIKSPYAQCNSRPAFWPSGIFSGEFFREEEKKVVVVDTRNSRPAFWPSGIFFGEFFREKEKKVVVVDTRNSHPAFWPSGIFSGEFFREEEKKVVVADTHLVACMKLKVRMVPAIKNEDDDTLLRFKVFCRPVVPNLCELAPLCTHAEVNSTNGLHSSTADTSRMIWGLARWSPALKRANNYADHTLLT